MPTTNDAIVADYCSRLQVRLQRELDWFAEPPTLRLAIKRAVAARSREAQLHPHQRRLKHTVYNAALGALIEEAQTLSQAHDFEAIRALIAASFRPIDGAGELYVYDTSLRIGAFLNQWPDHVFLHAGARKGAEAVIGRVRARRLSMSDFPHVFQKFAPHEMENLLCLYHVCLQSAA